MYNTEWWCFMYYCIIYKWLLLQFMSIIISVLICHIQFLSYFILKSQSDVPVVILFVSSVLKRWHMSKKINHIHFVHCNKDCTNQNTWIMCYLQEVCGQNVSSKQTYFVGPDSQELLGDKTEGGSVPTELLMKKKAVDFYFLLWSFPRQCWFAVLCQSWLQCSHGLMHISTV
jgi:hypothetical protein